MTGTCHAARVSRSGDPLVRLSAGLHTAQSRAEWTRQPSAGSSADCTAWHMTTERERKMQPWPRTHLSLPALPGARRLDRLLRFARVPPDLPPDWPNPYAVVAREDLSIHLFGMDDFDPAKSYGTAIVAVPDPDELYEAFAAGYGRATASCRSQAFPIGRPKRYGTVRGFSVIDSGGNWLRLSKLRDAEDIPKAPKPGILTKSSRPLPSGRFA